ncbi:MAG: zinc ABC transporter substrate-binding protein [Gammaproteobacteria bacterium]|nr:MAG: zinc ABC transporter substrate-binding protein [Gammaproteobacteria bacterium]
MFKQYLLRVALVWFALIALFGHSTLAAAKLNVVATTTSMGMLAKEVGGEYVSVTTLASPDRDTHYLQAKPSMMMALRKADLVIAVGADLEIGWLPAAIGSASNPKIRNNQPGYFEAAQFLDLISKDAADRSKGDVHPGGNPHFNLDPERMAILANQLALRLGELDKTHTSAYQANAQSLTRKLARLTQSLKQSLKQRVNNREGVVLMHNNADYLLKLLQVPVLGYMEPVPGIPPNASHLKGLADTLKNRQGIIIHAPYHQNSGPRKLAKILGWQIKVLPIEPPKGAGFREYRKFLSDWAVALNSGRG